MYPRRILFESYNIVQWTSLMKNLDVFNEQCYTTPTQCLGGYMVTPLDPRSIILRPCVNTQIGDDNSNESLNATTEPQQTGARNEISTSV